MNKRDLFAAVAMHALILRIKEKREGGFRLSDSQQSEIADEAYDIASEMLNERQGRPNPDEGGEIADAITEGFAELSYTIENIDVEKPEPS